MDTKIRDKVVEAELVFSYERFRYSPYDFDFDLEPEVFAAVGSRPFGEIATIIFSGEAVEFPTGTIAGVLLRATVRDLVGSSPDPVATRERVREYFDANYRGRAKIAVVKPSEALDELFEFDGDPEVVFEVER